MPFRPVIRGRFAFQRTSLTLPAYLSNVFKGEGLRGKPQLYWQQISHVPLEVEFVMIVRTSRTTYN